MPCAVRADLQDDVERLALAWMTSGKVVQLEPELLERGDVSPIRIDPRLLDPRTSGCVTVAVLGTPSVTFVLRFLPIGGQPQWPQDEWPESSVAGASQIARCGARKAMLARLVIEMRSPRAVVETVIGSSDAVLPGLRRALPHRDPGPMFPSSSTGPRPTSVPLKKRSAALRTRATRDGARETAEQLITADSSGMGAAIMRLEAGCHRLDVLSPAASERSVSHAIDVDIEVALASSGDVLASDATESADATASFCIGRSESVRARFIGSVPGVPVLMLQARWSLPDGLPVYWGPDAGARVAQVIRRYHDRPLGTALVYDSLGVAGSTILPMETEPGACYVAALAPIRGQSGGLALAAALGTRNAVNHGGPDGDGTTLAFCADAETHANLEVDARGAGLVWLLGVWQTGRMPLGEVQQ